jgi:hypothetical protein
MRVLKFSKSHDLAARLSAEHGAELVGLNLEDVTSTQARCGFSAKVTRTATGELPRSVRMKFYEPDLTRMNDRFPTDRARSPTHRSTNDSSGSGRSRHALYCGADSRSELI